MYTREVNGKEVELRNTGKLYKDALVMYDRETGTLWRQADGVAMRGPLAGQQLVEIPALQTIWKVWKKLHPDTLVLRKPADIRSTNYADYFMDNRCGLSGTRGDPRLDGKTLVVGVHAGDDAMAVVLLALKKRHLVEFKLAGQPVVAIYSAADQTPVVLRAEVEGRRLTFRLRSDGKQSLLEDEQTHSQWSPLEGHAIAGPLQGKQLSPLPYIVGYWYAWSAYRPQTQVLR